VINDLDFFFFLTDTSPPPPSTTFFVFGVFKLKQTSYELSLTVEKFYNGPFADDWPETGSGLHLHGPVTRYKAAWDQANSKLRPAAAATAVERSLAQVRFFVNESMPQIRAKVEERNGAKLDFESYKRRHETASAKSGSGNNQAKLQQLRQKLETSEARYNALNAKLKDEIIKEKIARDGIIEEATITFVVCQHAMYKELAANLGDLVEALPQDKVVASAPFCFFFFSPLRLLHLVFSLLRLFSFQFRVAPSHALSLFSCNRCLHSCFSLTTSRIHPRS
jgi:hypothetical protein